jgi:hypothetical protein
MERPEYHYQITVNVAGWVDGDDPEQVLEEVMGRFLMKTRETPWLKSVMEVGITQRNRGYVASHTGSRVEVG